MAGTTAIYIPTQKYYDDEGWNTVYYRLRDEAEYAEDIWNDDIGTESAYEMDLYYTAAQYRVELEDPDDTETALEQCQSYLENTDIFDEYDAVIVYDNRWMSDAGGMAYVKSCGTTFAVGYVAGSGQEYQTGAHELGHVYGGSHSKYHSWQDEESTFHYRYWYGSSPSESLLSASDAFTCYDEEVNYARTGWYAACTRLKAHDCIDKL